MTDAKHTAATRSSWSNKEASGPLDPIPYADDFNASEYHRLQHGLIPEAMEDKWFVFLEGGVLRFHRSWTGDLIYEVDLAAKGIGSTVTRAAVVRDGRVYRRDDDDYEARLLRFLVRGLVLGQDVEFPLPDGVPSHKGLYQHAVAGTGYPEESTTRPAWRRFKAWLARWRITGR